MFRLIRPLRIIEGKCYLQNVKMSSPMSQSHVFDVFKEPEKKEPGTESKNFKTDASVESEEASKTGKTHANGPNTDPNFFEEPLGRLTKSYTEKNINFGASLHPNLIISFDQHLNLASSDTLIQFLKYLASTKQRPYNLIKCAIDRLASITKEFTLMQCSVLLYSFSNLSYRDEAVLNKITESIKAQKSEFMEGVLPVSLLQSLGKLKYRNCEVIDILLQCVLKHKNVRTPDEKLTVLMTLAVVNYVSPLGTALLQEMLDFCEKDFCSTKSYLDFVWASVILNHLSVKHISSVLSDDFVNRLLLSAGSPGYDVCSLKLLNINAAAQTLMKDYNGPFLNKKISKTLHQSRSKTEFTRIVVDGLSYLYSKNKDIRVNIDTGAGFILDVEFSNKNNGYNKSKNYLENDDEKVGIILLGYNDICFDEAKTIIGLNTFKQRILKAKNYKIVNIPYTEYNDNMKLSEKIQYLRQKLKTVVDV